MLRAGPIPSLANEVDDEAWGSRERLAIVEFRPVRPMDDISA
jgi:hypothetical protein